ncbi:MAG: hypothetical protein QM612_05045 [Thermomonas sp.]|uniref:hypothetical protein n=1 Tax=Thermomonas sp. TaxID=1971895 RepID=UPI0039E5948B
MGKFDKTQDRAMELIGEIGDGLRKHVPDKAMEWVQTGAALGAMRTGGKVATQFVKRNPVLAGVAVVGVGLLWYAARQRNKRLAAGEPIEGSATRVDPVVGKRTRRRRSAGAVVEG